MKIALAFLVIVALLVAGVLVLVFANRKRRAQRGFEVQPRSFQVNPDAAQPRKTREHHH